MLKKVNSTYFKFPKPTGAYAVGIKSLHLTDRNRTELYAPAAKACRELMLTVWYPTDSKQSNWEPYAPAYLLDSIKGLFKPFEGISADDCAQIDTIRVPVIPDAPISSAQAAFPLVIFSHGYYGSRFYCSSVCQELASHGYVVIGIDHPYDAGVTELPGGRLVSWAPLTDAPEASDAFYQTFNTRLAVRVADVSFVLDCVAKRTDQLFAHIDMSKIGIFGHSLGAEAALQAAAQDARIQAVAAMDVFPVGQLTKAARHVPCLALVAQLTDWSKLEASPAVHAHLAQRAKQVDEQTDYRVLFKGADHVVFSDFALFSHMDLFKKLPQGTMFSIGSIDGFEAIQLVRRYLLAFLDKTLLHAGPAVLAKNIDDQNHDVVIKRS